MSKLFHWDCSTFSQNTVQRHLNFMSQWFKNWETLSSQVNPYLVVWQFKEHHLYSFSLWSKTELCNFVLSRFPGNHHCLRDTHCTHCTHCTRSTRTNTTCYPFHLPTNTVSDWTGISGLFTLDSIIFLAPLWPAGFLVTWPSCRLYHNTQVPNHTGPSKHNALIQTTDIMSAHWCSKFTFAVLNYFCNLTTFVASEAKPLLPGCPGIVPFGWLNWTRNNCWQLNTVVCHYNHSVGKTTKNVHKMTLLCGIFGSFLLWHRAPCRRQIHTTLFAFLCGCHAGKHQRICKRMCDLDPKWDQYELHRLGKLGWRPSQHVTFKVLQPWVE